MRSNKHISTNKPQVLLLEHPRPDDPERAEDVVNAPLSACLMTGYIASVLESNGIATEIVDANLFGWSINETYEQLKGAHFKLVGIHLIYLWEKTGDVFDLLSRLQYSGMKAHFNLYGYYPTFAYEDILNSCPFIDSITIGEPEHTFLELAKRIISPTNRVGFADIDGIAFRKIEDVAGGRGIEDRLADNRQQTNGGEKRGGMGSGLNGLNDLNSFGGRGERNRFERFEPLPDLPSITVKDLTTPFNPTFVKGEITSTARIIRTKPRDLIKDLDSIPFPDRRFSALSAKKGITTYIIGSRGCYNNCSFCYLNPFYGKDSCWRGRSPFNIFMEIDHLRIHEGNSSFYFADANFFGPGKIGKERLISLANLLIGLKPQISFGIECRANDVEEKLISLLARAGLKSIFLGIESGNQASLDLFRKNATVEVNRQAIETVRKVGLKLNIGFIMFGKDSSLDGIRRNFNFLQGMDLLTDPYTTAHLLHHRQTFFQGTPDYQDLRSQIDYPCQPFFSRYEMPFKDSDSRVSIFSEITTSFCHKALSVISGKWKRGGRPSGSGSGVEPFKWNMCMDEKAQGTRSEGTRLASQVNMQLDEGMSGNNYLNKLNKLIIRLFAQTLTSIEKGELDLRSEGVKAIKMAYEKEIEALDPGW